MTEHQHVLWDDDHGTIDSHKIPYIFDVEKWGIAAFYEMHRCCLVAMRGDCGNCHQPYIDHVRGKCTFGAGTASVGGRGEYYNNVFIEWLRKVEP